MSLSTPGFEGSALARTFGRDYGAGADADLPEYIRFLRGVASLAKKRFSSGLEEASHSPCIFLLNTAPKTPSQTGGRTAEFVPMIGNALSPIANRIWLTNHVVNESISYAIDKSESDADVWEFIRATLDLGGSPAVVIEARAGEVSSTFYPKGIDEPTLAEQTDLMRKAIDRDTVFAAIDAIYKDDLCTPGAQGDAGSAWHDATKCYPAEKAEKLVQRVLKVGLSRAFSEFVVRPEQPQAEGRTDLEIEEPLNGDRTVIVRHFILELKVLRDTSESGKTQYTRKDNEEIVYKGLTQATAYRDGKPARDAAVCTFDMRRPYSGLAIFEPIRTEAARVNIALWLWHLFSSSNARRMHTFAGGTHGGERCE